MLGADELMRAFQGQGVHAILGSGNSESSEAASHICNAFGVPMVGVASTSPVLSETERWPYFLRTIPTDELQGAVLAASVKEVAEHSPAVVGSRRLFVPLLRRSCCGRAVKRAPLCFR